MNLAPIGVSKLIHAKNWTKFCSTPHKVYLAVVREFLANFNPNILGDNDTTDDAHAFHTYVRGVWVPFSLAEIQQYYNVGDEMDVPNITD